MLDVMTTTYWQLRRVFAAAVLTAAVPGAGCAGSTGSTGETPQEGPSGARGSSVPLLPSLPPGVDYVAMRAAGDASASFGGRDDPQTRGLLLREMGARCSGQCGQKLAAELEGFNNRNALIVVKGETVARVEDGPTLIATFGPIDSPSKAGLLAWLTGYQLEGFVATDGSVAAPVAVVGAEFEVSTLSYQSCTPPPGTQEEQDVEWRDVMRITRDGSISSKERTVLRRGTLQPCMPLGRRPEGFCVRSPRTGARGWLTAAVSLEAASVPAFERLAGELAHHGAPRSLVRRAAAAARDERRHARALESLLGASVAPPVFAPATPRPLEAVATDNAVEGCVHETFAAAVATFQAQAAASTRVREVFAEIAADETRHAALAADAHRWFLSRLSPRAANRVRRARLAAVEALSGDVGRVSRVSTAAQRSLGLPTPAAERRLFGAVESALRTA